MFYTLDLNNENGMYTCACTYINDDSTTGGEKTEEIDLPCDVP